MQNEVLHALDKSIAKWEENCQIEDIHEAKVSAKDCPLCCIFLSKANPKVSIEKDCRGCPIKDFTGKLYCDDTPYGPAEEAYCNDDLETFVDAAESEVEFLREVRDFYLDKA